MAKEDLGKLSPEQLQRLASIISEAKNLTNQQAEIIGQVLAGEEDIGKLRISYLNRYFDSYSKNLDLVARKYRDLNDSFLTLEKKITNNYKDLSSEIDKLDQKLTKTTETRRQAQRTDAAKEQNSNTGRSASESTITDIAKDLRASIQTIANAISSAANKQSSVTGRTERANSSQNFKAAAKASYSAIRNAGGSRVNFAAGDLLAATSEANTGATPPTLPPLKAVEDTVPATSEAQLEELLQKALNDRKNFLDGVARDGDKYYTQESQLKARRQVQQLEQLQRFQRREAAIQESMQDLALARMADQENLLVEMRLNNLQAVLDAELEAQKMLNTLEAELKLASQANLGSDYNEAGDLRSRKVNAEDELADYKKLAEQKAEYLRKEELKSKLANNGILTKAEATRIQKEANEKFKADKNNLEKLAKLRLAQEEKEQRDKEKADKKAKLAERDGLIDTLTGKGVSLKDRKDAWKDLTTNPETGGTNPVAVASVMVKAIGDLAAKLNDTIDKVASYKGDIDTRLQGSTNEKWAGSYWDQLVHDMTSVGAITPFFKQEKFAENIKSLVDTGIAFDLKQRAFLMTIQEKIANTFNVADGTLLRLVRIQQEDSTAGRLGMESALNSFLNEMYENTEYLKNVASSVRKSLEEMESLMSGAAATEVEYQVQKWMGSLYSVGMSDTAVNAISTALGQLASGQVDALTSGGAGNLLVMAANEAGIPIADILSKGLDAKDTNDLLQATVNYLAEIANASKDSNVVQQQLANVFGVKASDLRAATNLAVAKYEGKYSISDIYSKNLTYDNLLNQLFKMAGSIASRTSIGEMMSNVWENGQYTLAGSMSSNPVAYIMYKAATLLDDTVGGIDFGIPMVMGNGMPISFNVADLIRVGAMGSGILGSIGAIVGGLGRSFSGKAMLKSLGIEEGNGLSITHRGGEGLGGGGLLDSGNLGGGANGLSGSGLVGNSSGSDIKNTTIQETEEKSKKQLIKAKEDEPANQIDSINESVVKIYELLDNVTKGNQTLRVRVDSYGLTNLNNSNAIGGVSGILSNNSTSNSLGGNGGNGSSFGGTDSHGAINLGGWTMT